MRLYSSLSYVRNVLFQKRLRSVSLLKCCVSSYSDPYTVLGIPRDADKAMIKSAYVKLAKLYHPDRNPDDEKAKKNFETIHNAYRILLERIANASEDPSDKDEVGYDFTVEPLGIESYSTPTLTQTKGYKQFWIFIFGFVLLSLSIVSGWRQKIIEEVMAEHDVTFEDEVKETHRKLARLKEANKIQSSLVSDMNLAIATLER